MNLGAKKEISLSSKDNTKFVWLTINPRPEVTLSEMKKVVEKFVKRTFIKNYVYVYEQRGSKENGKEAGTGHHCHILFQRDTEAGIKSWDVKKRSKTSFKSITDVDNNSIFNWHNCPEEYIQDKINYMTNKNLDEDHKDKEQKQSMDKEWRKTNKLKEIYYTFNLQKKNDMYIYNNGTEESEETDQTEIEETGNQ